MELYPLKFKPIYKEKVWGGDKWNLLDRKITSEKAVGESWELSAVKGELSKVSEGFLKGNDIQELIEVYMGDLVGDKVYNRFGIEFPLLFKFINSNEKLSLQVHPDDELALKRHKAYGKTEMWYVVGADEDSPIYVGLSKDGVTGKELVERIKNDSFNQIINVERAKSGDVFFLPAGRVHAIGEGLLIAEIQQTSDITYRIYDWGRENDPATAREMHLDLAMDAIDYRRLQSYRTEYEPKTDQIVKLVTCPYFTTNLLDLTRAMERDYSELDSFVVYMCLDGAATIECNGTQTQMSKGETVLIPAVIPDVIITPDEGKAKFMETYI
ncbi:MAG: class I mannose-6-phosphate isomerase [Prevotellaceae bacterium]|jgi:mannose-6-phosphate isomerase|nr:class I mannose-6-phosphate isomerase [Prevotellaceae bacterium]